MTSTDTIPMTPLLFPDDSQFWYETLRVLGHTAYGGADFGEVVTTAVRISAGLYDSWYEQWAATAQRVEAEARGQLAAGHQVSGRDGLLRAATYFRTAEFFTRDRDPDPRGRAAYEASVRCFADAAAVMSPAVTPVRIPFEGTALPGYLYQSPRGGPQPTFIMHSGFDGWAEELHHCGALAAQERGYTVITFDGPGQAGPCYDGLVFRPNWETVVSPVIDWAATRPEVDPGRIALGGWSMGGGLAPRAAAFDPRIRALICIDGIYDIGQAYTERLGLGADTERRLTAETDPELDALAQELMQSNPQVRWACRNGMWSFGVDTPRAFLGASRAYNLRDGIAERITCPVFVGRGESDQFFLGQPEELMQHLTAPAMLANFADAEGAGAHCQAGAQRLLCARMLDWLDDALDTPGQLAEASRDKVTSYNDDQRDRPGPSKRRTKPRENT
jgi:dienelactone hydrolase